MMKNKEYIAELIEAFFDGKTNNMQEQELFQYFSQDIIDGELEQYRSTFHYFETEIKEELNSLELVENYDKVPSKNKNIKLLLVITAVAASLLLAILYSPLSPKGDLNPYKGSYVMVNGVKNYDLDIHTIEKLEKEILANLAEKENKRDDIINSAEVKNANIESLAETYQSKKTKYQELINNINNINNKMNEYEVLMEITN